MKTTTVEKNTTRRGIVMMVLSVTGFTANSLLLKYLGSTEHSVSAMLPLMFRAAVGTIIVLTIFRGRRPTLIKPVFTHRKLILRGLTGMVGTAAYYWTIPAMGAAKATLLCNTYVIFAAIIAAVWLREKIGVAKAFWLVSAFVGIALLTGPNGESGHFSFGWNEAIALVGAVAAAWTVVLIRELVKEHSSGTIFLAQCAWILLPVSLMTVHELPGLSGIEWTLMIAAASMAAFGQLTMNEGYRCLTVAVGASLQMLWPVMTAVGGLVWFDERFLPVQIVGAVLILGATWRISVAKKTPKP